MTPADRHAQAVQLFLDALDRPADTREAWIAEEAQDNETLRSDALALLQAHSKTKAFFDAPVLEREEEEDEIEHTVRGRMVGPWRILDRLGEGGMGVVYRAERADGLYERTVALKLLAPTAVLASGDRLARRLAAERQILARLEHDGIARLYDGGVTSDGLPFLALELIDGAPLTEYADQHGLDAAQRAALFTRACDAVAYAHRRLVVHRDLKPAHILVTQDGTRKEPAVKLLDFGVSALLDDPSGDDDGLTKMTVPRALTPAYAAPEQVRGEPVTTASDVYALGVVLYELLAGQRPYDLTGKTASEAERLVAEVDPPLPSAVAAPGRERALRGDLDTIVMKALAKEPERRYASADALADDLRRHLSGQPVRARKATAGYRVSRFVRRHRIGVATTVAVLLLAIALVGFYTARLAAERDQTAVALSRAEGTLDFLRTTILSGDPQQGDFDAPLSAVLDSAAARVDAVEDEAVAAALRAALATVYVGRGLPEEAEALARRAEAFYAAEEARTGIATVERGENLDRIAVTVRDQRKLDEALALHEQALAYLRTVPDGDYDLSLALNNYGATLFKLDRSDEAVAAYQEAIDIRRTLADPRERDAFTPLHNIAVIRAQQGRSAEAAAVSSELVDELRASDDPRARHNLAFALYNWATALRDLGDYEQTIRVRQEGIEVGSDVLGADHPDMAPDHIALMTELYLAGRSAEAIRKGEETLVWLEAIVGPDHSYMSLLNSDFGLILCDTGDPGRGIPFVQRGLANRRSRLPPEHLRIAEGESILGHCLGKLGQTEQAEALMETSYLRLVETKGTDHPQTRLARERLRDFYQETGRTAEAAALDA